MIISSCFWQFKCHCGANWKAATRKEETSIRFEILNIVLSSCDYAQTKLNKWVLSLMTNVHLHTVDLFCLPFEKSQLLVMETAVQQDQTIR